MNLRWHNLVRPYKALMGSVAVAVVVPEAPSCSQRLPEAPRGSQKLPEAPRGSQTLPKAPRGSQRL